ncbi:hypothetical protein D3C87_1188070 [compost metagenome]
MGVGQATEQHGRIVRFDQRDARCDRPDAITGRQCVRYEQVGVGVHLTQLDAERVLAGRCLDTQGDYGIRRVDRLVEELIGNTEVDVADLRVTGHGFFGCHACGATIAAA